MNQENQLSLTSGVGSGTLVYMRWLAVAGQSTAILGAYLLLGIDLPLAATLAVTGISAALNLFIHFKGLELVSNKRIFGLLCFDTLQIASLLLLAGGLENPFSLFLLAPAAVGAALLDGRHTVFLLGVFALTLPVLYIFAMPLEWPGNSYEFPKEYKPGMLTALLLSCGFTAFYIRRTLFEAVRLNRALSAMRLALARQEQDSRLGILAAAATHELGSPLNTISLIAGDIKKEIEQDSPLREDVELLASQIGKCKSILMEFSSRPREITNSFEQPIPLEVLLAEISDQYKMLFPSVKVIVEQGKASPAPPPEVIKTAELSYGLGNIIKNAFEFAGEEIRLVYFWDENYIFIVIEDDGPGFSSKALSNIGSPYFSERKSAGKNMGLGIFIARTLLERTGAILSFSNRCNGKGARIAVQWPRNVIDSGGKRF